MYARIEVYPVMDRLHCSALILERAEHPSGLDYEPVWAATLEIPGSPTGEPVDDLWCALVALNEQLEAATAALR